MDHHPSRQPTTSDSIDTNAPATPPVQPLDAKIGDKIEAKIGDHASIVAVGTQITQNIQQVFAVQPPSTPIESDEAPAPGDPPYQGMEYFDVKDAERFFGREQLTAELVEHLRQHRLLLVIGASGSGKSSLVRAGLVATLQGKQPLLAGTLPLKGSARWLYHLITPTARPLESLAATLTRASESVTATSTLIDDLLNEPRSLHLYARRLVSGEQRLLLLVDQFEELFTLCKDATQQQAFVENLLQAAQPDGVVTLVLTLRADFYHHCAKFPALRAALESQQHYIGDMNQDELRRAIEEPAKQGNWTLQEGLVEQLLHDVGDEPGALPLLSHALHETWLRRQGRRLTLIGYQASGKVQGAIAQTADAIYNRFSERHQTIARTIFLRLTELGEGSQDTRRRVSADELRLRHIAPEEVQQVLKTLADARLLTTDRQQTQVAHEALIRTWPTLRGWLDDDREGHRIHRHLTEAAHQWQSFDRDVNLLYRGVLLQQAEEWRGRTVDPPNELESEFLQESQQEVEAAIQRETALEAEREANRQRELASQRQLTTEQTKRANAEQRRTHMFRWATTIVTILFIAALGLARWGWQSSIDASAHAATSIAARATSDTNANEAKISQAKAEDSARLAHAGALAANAKIALDTDPELGVILAQHSLNITYTFAGEEALRQALQRSRIETTYPYTATDLTQIVFSPDKNEFVTGDQYGQIVRRSSQTGAFIQSYSTEPSWVTTIAYSPVNHNVIAYGNESGTLALLKLDSREIITISSSKLTIYNLVFTSDGAGIIASRPTHVEYWDITNKKILGELPESNVLKVALSPDQRFLALGNWYGEINIWDVSVGVKLIPRLRHQGKISDITFNTSGQYLATTGQDNLIKIWVWSDIISSTIENPEPFNLFNEHVALVQSLDFNTEGSCLVSVSEDQTAILWHVMNGEVLRLLGHHNPVLAARFESSDQVLNHSPLEPCGSRLTTISADGTVRHWNIGATYEYHTWSLFEKAAQTIDVHPNNQLIAVAGDEGKINLLDPLSGLIEREFSHTQRVNNVAFSPDGTWLASASGDGTAKLWNLASSPLTEVTLTGHIGVVTDVEFRQPNGQQVATIGQDRKLHLWDTQSGKLIQTYPLTYTLTGIAFSQDGNLLLSGSNNQEAMILDVNTGEQVATIPHEHTVNFVTSSPQNHLFATGDASGVIMLGTTHLPIQARYLSTHNAPVYAGRFSPNEQWLATAGADGRVVIWDLHTGQPVSILQASADSVTDVKFMKLPEGLTLVATGVDGAVRLYLVNYQDLAAFASKRITRKLFDMECKIYLNKVKCS